MLFDNDNSIFSFIENSNIDYFGNMLRPAHQNIETFKPAEALTMGNGFTGLYKPYKNYRPMPPTPKNDREASLLKVQQLDFMVSELNLYLNIYPHDKECFDLFKKYDEEEKMAINEYERKYGPLLLENDKGSSYDWSKSPWPWEEGGRY